MALKQWNDKDQFIPKQEYVGLSTDTKPTSGVDKYSLFLELDKGDFYYFDGTDWQIVGGGS